ncbi:hypothetical protein NMG60_11005687 [Bertholletia excelsa]
MEFKFRAIDKQAWMHRFLSPTIGYFTEPALRVSNSSPGLGRTMELFRSPSNVHEAIQWKLEKDVIRREIIATEIAWRQVLEAEVRREMFLEREMALGKPEGLSLFSGLAMASAMPFQLRLPHLQYPEDKSLEGRLALSLEERLASQLRSGIRDLKTFPFQNNAEPKILEVKPPSEVSKQKIMFLAKPKENLSGTKRKAVTPPAVGSSSLPSVGVNKKAKEEWSCALCQVSATSERGLNEHLQGRKHKAREAGLRARRTGKNYRIGLFPKKSKPTKLGENSNNQIAEKAKLEEHLLQVKSTTEDVGQIKGLTLQENKSINDLRIKNKDLVQKIQKTRNDKKKFKFWCEMCQIGAYSEKAMDCHKSSKKHLVRLLQKLNKNGGSIPTLQVEGEEEGELGVGSGSN